MKLPSTQAGAATIYGFWDDLDDYQFIVIWGESGPTCTVLLLSGWDYGGGVTCFSDQVPVKLAKDIVDADLASVIDHKRRMTDLVKQYSPKLVDNR